MEKYMKVIKRLFIAVSHRLDSALSSFENHEALSIVAIKEAKESLAKGKVHLNRITRDGEALLSRVNQFKEEIILWENRAKESVQTNHANALECMKRRKQSVDLLRQLETELTTHIKVETQLKSNLNVIEEKIGEYERKRNILKTRASRASSAAELQSLENECSPGSLSDTLSRWEDQISEQEFLGGSSMDSSIDTFESTYSEKEETSILEVELARLLETSTLQEA